MKIRISIFCLLMFCVGFVPDAFSQCSSLKLVSDKSIICAPGIVHYSIIGAPTGSSFLWDFGSGYSSHTDTVHQFYLSPQIVDVSVKVTFPDGTKCNISKSGIAEIKSKPTPSYQISRTILCDGPDTITLLNTTPKTKDISWVVDGTNYFNSTNQLIHRFKTEGIKNLNMVVTDSFGCRNVQEFTKIAIVYPDVDVDFEANNTSGCITQSVQFTPKINNKGEEIQAINWKFNGANISNYNSLNPPKLTYAKSGNFDVSLSVTTDKGCVHTVIKKNYLQFGDSIEVELQPFDTLLCLKNELQLKIKNQLNGKYTWILGGTPDTSQLSNSELKLKYNQPGNFDVLVSVDYNGCHSQSSIQTIHVKDVKADFSSSDNYHCYIPHTTTLKNLSYSSDSSAMTYQWKYTDAGGNVLAKSTNKNGSFYTANWGKYDVQLIVKDAYGCTDTMKKGSFIRVDSIRPLFSSLEQIACINQTVKIISTTPPSSYLSADTFYWIIYDLDKKTIYNSGKGREISQSFSKPGFYDVKLQAGNTIGCKDTLKKEQYIQIVEPIKGIRLVDTVVCLGSEIKLEATTKPIFAPFKHEWILTNKTSSKVVTLKTDTVRLGKTVLPEPGDYWLKYRHQISDGCLDSIERPNSIHINAITGNIVLDHSDGCLPMKVNPTFKKEINYHYGQNSDDLQFEWSVQPAAGVNIDNIHTSNPKITITEKGMYRVYVRVFNSTNCTYSASSEMIYAGVSASFSSSHETICAGQEATLRNESSLNPTAFEWSVFSTGTYKIDATSNPIIFEPNSDAHYLIRLVANKNNECYDTTEKSINAIKVTSHFVSTDTNLFCAPAYAQFKALSQNADTFFWNFGDGNKIATTDTFVANIYSRNSGFKKGFNVELISKNKLGCADTTTRKNEIKVFGPIPEFEISNYEGCEPLNVSFINKSESVQRFYLNFDDNSELDSTYFSQHSYRVLNNQMQQKYLPNLYVIDSLGCAAVYESADTIRVLKSPVAVLSTTQSVGCSPVKILVSNLSQNITEHFWQMDDTTFSTASVIDTAISSFGSHQLALIVKNSNMCADTANFDILSHANPSVSIHYDTIPCFGFPVDFWATNNSSQTIQKYYWQMENRTDSVSTANYSRLFASTGFHSIELFAIDSNGCSAKVDSSITIKGVNDIPPGNINYVTITSDNQIEIHWSPVNTDFLAKTTVVNNANGDTVYNGSINSASKTTYTTNDIKNNCFGLYHSNKCNENGKISVSHCPIILSVAKGDYFELNLSWSAYSGWNNLQNYTIYRAINGGNFEVLSMVDAYTLSYTDSGLCNNQYSYYVEATNGNFWSKSNKETDQPLYLKNTAPLDVKVATVKDNSFVLVTWNADTFPYNSQYFVTKYDTTGTIILEEQFTPTTEFIDNRVSVISENFLYRVQSVDKCQEKGVAGNFGKPMILTGEYRNNAAHLNWTAYEQWQAGVNYYNIELLFEDGFKSVGTVSGTTHFVDSAVHEAIRGEYIYRVSAVSYIAEVQSLSNNVHLHGSSIIWIPNVFSPNEDIHNPIFKPTLQFMYLGYDGNYRDYSMRIYSRWGELIFETNDVDEGWDGTYMGKPCQAGSYLYHIQVTGLDRFIYDKKGLVRLMR